MCSHCNDSYLSNDHLAEKGGGGEAVEVCRPGGIDGTGARCFIMLARLASPRLAMVCVYIYIYIYIYI